MLKNFWYAICLATEASTKPHRVTALGMELVVFRTEKGEPVVMSDLCVHRGGALSDGWTKGECIVCPYHGWEFNSDGSCARIPANIEGRPIPRKARLDKYPTVEKYGFVFAFLGDLPEAERPPLVDIPEYTDPKYKPLWGDYWWNCHYTRAVENGMDIAHAPFVHAGSFGNPNEPEVEEYEVEKFDWGGDATVTLNPPAPKGIWKYLRGKGRPGVKTTGGYRMPNCTRLNVRLPIGEFVLYTFHLPVEENKTRSMWVFLRTFFHQPFFDGDSRKRVLKIFNEDRRTVLEQRPELLPYDLSAELHVRSDRIQVDFRKKRNRYLDMGWGIDSHLIRAEYANVKAVVIPSPARREIPELANAWVMKEVPTKQPSRLSSRSNNGPDSERDPIEGD
ncbi:MAG TPA: aromatic ring-hydroxylating dioxygenase subunit alpha [Phototrophicaceae bacterium]|jgi:phenylpropionate dioxygenase-like ring-hydroxylating dioxygenase large terminal subunit|nr:aromatic ring-hydroxylating dioxygenase subunit alpha [Phototrophicaceae bacterium]